MCIVCLCRPHRTQQVRFVGSTCFPPPTLQTSASGGWEVTSVSQREDAKATLPHPCLSVFISDDMTINGTIHSSWWDGNIRSVSHVVCVIFSEVGGGADVGNPCFHTAGKNKPWGRRAQKRWLCMRVVRARHGAQCLWIDDKDR